MDDSAAEFKTFPDGTCTFCNEYKNRRDILSKEDRRKAIDRVERLSHPPGSVYHCVIGISGGLDSSFVAHLVKGIYGWNPLALIIDNGWDTPQSLNNSNRLVKALNIDTLRIKLPEEYKKIQLALLRSGTINAEVASDMAIIASLYKAAHAHGIKYIIHGGNLVTEGIMPESWGYDAKDWRFINDVCNRYGIGKFSTRDFPHMTLWDWFRFTYVDRIKWFPLLNYWHYNPASAAVLLHNVYGWEYYGYKHMENVYTRWFQGFVLPRRWGIDKRKAHFSSLIMEGFRTRKEYEAELDKPYYDSGLANEDTQKIAEWLGLTEAHLKIIIDGTPRRHFSEFKNNAFLFKLFGGIARKFAIAA